MMEKKKEKMQVFFTLYNVKKPEIIVFYNYTGIAKVIQEAELKRKPKIFGRLFAGDYRTITAGLNEFNISYEITKSRYTDVKQKYILEKRLTETELHLLRDYYLNNRIMLIPPTAKITDSLAEFGIIYNMPILSKWLRLVKPVSTVDLDFHNFSGDVSEGSTYVNSGYENSNALIQPSIFELKETDFTKITKDKYKKQILSIAKYTKDIPIILAVLSDNCELTFFNTNRSTGEVLFTNTIRLVAGDSYTVEPHEYKGYREEQYKKAMVYTYVGREPATKSQKELFTKIYKQLTEYDTPKT